MKKLMSYTMIALLATIAVSIAAPDKAEIMAKEKAAWQAFKDKNADDFKKVVDGDMVGVYADGIANMAKELADMQKWDMKSFKISDYKATSDRWVVSNNKVFNNICARAGVDTHSSYVDAPCLPRT